MPPLSSPPHLHLRLLGAPTIELSRSARVEVSSVKAQALLYYLAVTGRAHTRAHLASLLWGDLPDEAARGNLRKALGDLGPTFAPYLAVNRQTVAWHSDTATWVDVHAFTARVNNSRPRNSTDMEQIKEGIELYRGDFLEGFYVRAAPDFEMWTLAERAQLRERMLQGLETLAQWLAAQGDLTQAIVYTRRLLELEPWREETHRQLMEWLAQDGQRSAALAQYELCRRALVEELDIEPDGTTQALYRRLLRLDQSEQAGQSLPLTTEFALVGRRPEWQVLVSTWQKSIRGAAHFVAIGGEPGIGKTRLAEEMLVYAQRQGYTTARSRAYALVGQLAYAPIAEWLRNLAWQTQLHQLADIWLTELARLLPELLVAHPNLPQPQPLTARWQQKRFFEALVHAFTAARLPVFLVLDDLQWCDPETLEWLQYLLKSTPVPQVLVVGTVRIEEVDEEHPLQRLWLSLLRDGQLSKVNLAPLNAEESVALANQVANQSLSTASATRLYEETAGNPLFIVESIRASAEQLARQDLAHISLPLPAEDDAGNSHRLPPKVHAVLRERLLRLSAQARDLAQVAATIGRAFTIELLCHVGNQDEESVLAGLDELWRRRIVREVDAVRYDFSHDRLRDCAYLEASPVQRRLLHRRIAQALHQLHAHNLAPVAGELGLHYERGGRLQEAYDAYLQAAQAAKQLYAHREVVDYLGKSITVLQRFPDRFNRAEREIDLLLELGQAEILNTGWGSEPVGRAWRQAYELALQAGKKSQQCRALRLLSMYHDNRGELRKARALAEQSMALLEGETDEFLRERVLAQMGVILAHVGEQASALGYFEQVLALTRTKPTSHFNWGGRSSFSGGLIRSALCLWLLGFPDQARLRCDQAVQVAYETVGQSFELVPVSAALDFSAMVYSFCRDVQTVQRLGEELLELATKYEFPFYVRAGQMYIGWALAQQGEASTGAAMIRASVDQHRSEGIRKFEPYWRSLLAEALALAGQFSEALDEVEDALAFAEETENGYWNAHLLKLKADYLLAQLASADEVEHWYERAVTTARQQGARSLELRATLALCRLWAQQAKRQEACKRLASLYSSFTEGWDTADLQEAQMLLAHLCGELTSGDASFDDVRR